MDTGCRGNYSAGVVSIEKKKAQLSPFMVAKTMAGIICVKNSKNYIDK